MRTGGTRTYRSRDGPLVRPLEDDGLRRGGQFCWCQGTRPVITLRLMLRRVMAKDKDRKT
jgi:hypothetical protein